MIPHNERPTGQSIPERRYERINPPASGFFSHYRYLVIQKSIKEYPLLKPADTRADNDNVFYLPQFSSLFGRP